MSLIEEALRKQREETEQGGPTGTPSAQSTPPPLPEDNQEAPPAVEPHRAWPLLVGVTVVSLIVIAGLVWLLFFGMKILGTKSKSRETAAATVVPNAPSNATPETATNETQSTVAIADSPSSSAPETNAPIGEDAAVPTAPQDPASGTSTPPVALTAPAPTPSDMNPAAATAAGPAAGEDPNVFKIGAVVPNMTSPAPEKVQTVIWPRLTVSGIIGTTRGSRGAVIINGQMLGIGSTIEGVKVVAVDKLGVQLSFAGETRTLTVGGTTE